MRITGEHEAGVIQLLESMNNSPVPVVKMATSIIMVYGPTLDQLVIDLNNNIQVENMRLYRLAVEDIENAIRDLYTPEFWYRVGEDTRNSVFTLTLQIWSAIITYYIDLHKAD